MKNSKKLLSVALSVMMLAAMTTGCGAPKEVSSASPSSKAESTPASTTESKAESTPAAAPTGIDHSKAVNLVWYQFVDRIMPDHEKVIAEANNYLKEKINATVTANFMSLDDYNQKMPVIISSGQEFDVCFSTSWMLNYNEYVAKKAFRSMNDLLDTYAPETKAFIPESYWNGISVNGNIYGVPGYKEAGHQFGIMYNKDMADELKLDLSNIKKLADMEPALKAIKEKRPDLIGVTGSLYNSAMPHEHVSGDWMLPGVLNVPGMELYKNAPAGKLINQFETPEFAEFANMAHSWYQSGYLPSDPVGYGNAGTANTDMKEKKLFSFLIWYAPGCEPGLEAQYGCKLGYIPLFNPILETADTVGGAVHCISQGSKNPERAMEFINILETDEKFGTLIRHGIEGTHYTLEGDQCKMKAPSDNPTYDYGSGWPLGTIFNQKWTTAFAANNEQLYLDFNANLSPTTALGFTFDQSNVKTEIASLNNVIKEFFEPITQGIVDPKQYIPKFNEKLKANGLDAYMAELQKQFDAWKK
ncbi:MAG: ABC transporter substrate-binding protein [Angelakisella sp.]